MTDDPDYKYPPMMARAVVDLLGLIADLASTNIQLTKILVHMHADKIPEREDFDLLTKHINQTLTGIKDVSRHVPREKE